MVLPPHFKNLACTPSSSYHWMFLPGDPEEDFEWMIVIHEAHKVFIGSGYYPPQGSSISKRFIDKVQELQSQGFDFIIAGDWNARSETWNDTGSNKHGDHVEMLVELLDVPMLSDGMPTHMSKVTKKLDGVLDFGIGSNPFAAMRLDEDYAARSGLITSQWCFN